MDYTGTSYCICIYINSSTPITKKYNPHAVLLFSGLFMMLISWSLGYDINSLLSLESLEKKMKIGFKSSSGEANSINNFLIL